MFAEYASERATPWPKLANEQTTEIGPFHVQHKLELDALEYWL